MRTKDNGGAEIRQLFLGFRWGKSRYSAVYNGVAGHIGNILVFIVAPAPVHGKHDGDAHLVRPRKEYPRIGDAVRAPLGHDEGTGC